MNAQKKHTNVDDVGNSQKENTLTHTYTHDTIKALLIMLQILNNQVYIYKANTELTAKRLYNLFFLFDSFLSLWTF